MKIVALDHIQIAMPKGREEEARDFYQNILGIPEVPKPIALAKRGGAWFEYGQVKIHLGVEDDFRPALKAHPALLVSDLDQLIVALNDKGFTVTEDDSISGVKRVFSNDPFGNRIEFIQEVS
ncbi:MAG: glyoxalase [Gammaproteobacteria bacterium RIFCSPLOWO2_02_FULL_57_10]|nr:MAG: glyoxalase [Gammaproteobacteria bacterium RIFCSPLOWO2_02_FULL_57_10]